MVSNLEGVLGDINEVTTVLPVCETSTSDVSAQKAFLEAMTPIAEKFIAEANAQGEDSPRMAFLIVTERRFSPIPDFSGFSRDGGVQKLPARLISSELSAHQMAASTTPPFVRAGYDCRNNTTVLSRPEAVGWAPLVCAGSLTTSLRGLWVSGLLPPGNGGTNEGAATLKPTKRPRGLTHNSRAGNPKRTRPKRHNKDVLSKSAWVATAQQVVEEP